MVVRNLALKSRIVFKFGTQTDFSHALNIDETVVSRIINGRRELDSATQKKWAALLECPVEELFGG